MRTVSLIAQFATLLHVGNVLAQGAPPPAVPSPAAPPPAAGRAPAAQAPPPATTQAPAAAAGPQSAEEQDAAQEAREEQARAQYNVGKSLYDAGRFAEAAAEWMKAYELSPHSDLLYNAYLAYRDAGDTANARDVLERYLATDGVPADLRVSLEARLRVLQEGAAADEQPQAAPVAEPASEPAPEPATQQVHFDSADSDLVPWVLISLGGAMLVGGTVTGFITLNKVNEIEDECPNDRCPADYDLEAAKDEAGTTALVTDVLLVGGAAAAAVGIVLALVGGDEAPPTAASDAPQFACGGSGCTFRTTF